MKTIRKHCFETNSSSTHSLSIVGGDYQPDTVALENGDLILRGGEFGWESVEFKDAMTKANYVAVMLLEMKESAMEYKKLEGYSDYSLDYAKWCVENYDKCLYNFEAVLKEMTHCSEVVWSCTVKYGDDTIGNYSYIDHQSIENISDLAWLLDMGDIRNFIFNKESVLETGNDNC